MLAMLIVVSISVLVYSYYLQDMRVSTQLRKETLDTHENVTAILSRDAQYPSPVIQLQQTLTQDRLEAQKMEMRQNDGMLQSISYIDEPPKPSQKLIILKQKLKQLQSTNQ